jgi:3-deoxy-7-phosphoheptulonate synthase
VLALRSARPVVRVGRIAGQFAKPRSQRTELVDGRELDVYRGHMVNSPEPDAQLRVPDPKRLLSGYWAASSVLETIRAGNAAERADRALWTSHEALLLDFEVPMVRADRDGYLLSSTHWPWIGERTRQVDGAHVAVMASVTNPVACKVGPTMTTDEVLGLCARLDPRREPGRLTLISRMGAGVVADRLPPLVRAVRAEGHPVIWLCDPMHGNTVLSRDGRKTRHLGAIIAELTGFFAALRAAGGWPGGIHLETTGERVTECLSDVPAIGEADLARCYTTACDPRLNPDQTREVARVVAGLCVETLSTPQNRWRGSR